MDQPEWMSLAWEEVGVKEVAGKRDNPRIMQFYRDVGEDTVSHDETPWCAAFVGSCLERAGNASSRSLRARSYLNWGRELAAPRAGAIAVLSRGSNPALGHVGFLIGATKEKLYLLGGNQSDSVRISAYARSRLLGLRWPEAPGKRSEDDTAAGPQSDGRATVDDLSTHADELFERGLAHVLEMEGGYTDDPHDPGGATNYGITIGDYAREKGVAITAETMGALKAELRRIAPEFVRDIYVRRYWQKADCPKLPPALALMQFDTAVNQGVGRAARFLQESLGAEIDGEIGPQTLAAALGAPLHGALENYADVRRRHYRGLHHFWRFGRGWLRRVNATLALAKAEIGRARAGRRGETIPKEIPNQSTPASEKETTQMATKPNLKPATKWWGESMTIWGAIITTLSTVLPTLGPLIGLDITGELIQQLGEHMVRLIEVGGGIIGIVMTIFGRVRATALLERRQVSVKL